MLFWCGRGGFDRMARGGGFGPKKVIIGAPVVVVVGGNEALATVCRADWRVQHRAAFWALNNCCSLLSQNATIDSSPVFMRMTSLLNLSVMADKIG